jgi:hypothetical protein
MSDITTQMITDTIMYPDEMVIVEPSGDTFYVKEFNGYYFYVMAKEVGKDQLEVTEFDWLDVDYIFS